MGKKSKSHRAKHVVRSNGVRVAGGVAVPGKPYSPRPGSVPGWIYASLVERPMLFGELSERVGKATGMTGDNLASQLSASLRELVVRGVVARLNYKTHKPVAGSAKNARGALYSLVPAAKASYIAQRKVRSASPGPTREIARLVLGVPASDAAGSDAEPKQRDLSTFAMPVGKPAGMPDAMYMELKRAEEAARAQLSAIDSMLRDPAWT